MVWISLPDATNINSQFFSILLPRITTISIFVLMLVDERFKPKLGITKFPTKIIVNQWPTPILRLWEKWTTVPRPERLLGSRKDVFLTKFVIYDPLILQNPRLWILPRTLVNRMYSLYQLYLEFSNQLFIEESVSFSNLSTCLRKLYAAYFVQTQMHFWMFLLCRATFSAIYPKSNCSKIRHFTPCWTAFVRPPHPHSCWSKL